MEWLGLCVLGAIVAQLVLTSVSNLLNVSAMDTKIPKEFVGVYDEKDYDKSQRYAKAKMQFGMLEGIYGSIVFLFFWWWGNGFATVDAIVRTYTDYYIYQGLLFFLIYQLADMLFSLPWEVYNTFVLEARFDFNRTSVGTFVTDRLKGLGLGVVLGGPLISVMLWMLKEMGDNAWWMCWLAIATFTIVFQFLAPALIFPLFFKFSPLPVDSPLLVAIQEMTKKLKFQMQGVYEIDGSRRSSHSNAFFTGFGKYKRIALFDTLIKSHSIPEILAVLAHEIGHNKCHHMIYNTIFSLSQMLVTFYLSCLILNSPALFHTFQIPQPSLHLGLLLSFSVISPFHLVVSVVAHILSRKFEFEADRFSVENFGDGNELVEGLKKLSKENASNLTPHWFYVFLNYSHPPVMDRIRYIRSVAKNLRAKKD